MPSKSMSPMPIQSKIGDASLKFGPDWLRALSSSDSGSGGGGGGGGSSDRDRGAGGWSTGSGGGGGGGMRDGGGTYSSAASSNQHQHHHHSNYNPPTHRERLSSSGNSSSGNSSTNASRFQPPEFGYGREEMLALFDKNLPPPDFLPAFGTLFVEKMQPPLAFSQPSEDELRVWHVPQPESSRQSNSGPPPVGRGGFAIRGRGIGTERGGRGRGRGGGGYYPRPHEEDERGSFSRPRTFERSQSAHERVWAERNGGTGGLAPSPPEDGGARGGSWRTRESYGNKRYENEDDGWRKPRWRRGDEEEDAPRSNSNPRRLHKSWSDDGTQENLPEWARDNPSEESGTFDSSGAFHEEDRYSAKSNAFEQTRRDLERNREGKSESEPYGSQNGRVQKRTPERNDTKDAIPSSILEEEHEDLADDRVKTSRHQQLHYRSSDSKVDVSNTKSKTASGRNDDSGSLAKQTHQSSVDSSENLTSQDQPLSDESIVRQSNQTHTQQSVESRIPIISRNLNPLQEEHYYSMTEEADMVAKLIEDDGSIGALPSSSVSLSSSIPSRGSLNMNSGQGAHYSNSNSEIPVPAPPRPTSSQQTPVRPPSPLSFEIWLYRDPQGSVQGPFATHEMAQWYSQGYFTGGLMLRRECDKVFITLAEMGKLYGRNPFIVIPDTPPPPPLLDSSSSALDNSPDPNIQAQYQRQLLQQNLLRDQQQQYLLKLGQSGIRKEGEAWQGQAPTHPQFAHATSPGPSGVTQALQTQMILNIAKQAGVIVNDDNTNPIEHLQAIFNRQAQGKASDAPPGKNVFNPMMQPQMNSQMDVRKSPTQTSADPIQSLVQQLTNMVNPQHAQQQQKMQINKQLEPVSHWGNANVSPAVQQQQIGGWPNQPHGNTQNQMWEYREQLLKLQQQKMEGEMLRQKKEEEQERKRLMEEEERKRQEEQQRFEAEELEKRKQMEEQYLLQKKQEELIKEQQAADLARQKEFLMQQQRLHQQEMERQQQRFEQQRLEQQRLEQQRAEQQRLEQQRAEQARIEQQLRQEQQEREEQQRRVQQELEEQQRRLQAEHEERQRQHQLRLQEEQEAAKQHELQKFAWMTAHVQQVQPTEPAPPALSLLEIQQEEAIKEQENALRQQAAKKSKQLQQEQARLQKEAKSGLSLKWAQPAQPQKVAIKSFTEIQAEEQAKLAKQQEKDREQRAIVNQHSQLQQAWSSSLTWANRASLNAPPTTPKLNGGIWDDPPALGGGTSGGKQAKTAAAAVRNSSPSNTSTGAANASNKHTAGVQPGQAKRAKESDETFMKLFQEHGMNMKHSSRTQSQQDEFTRWCSETVEGIGGGNIDIATFVSFLKEVESPFEVNDYIRSYLGDGRDAREFGKEFLERRSRWKNAKNQDKDGGGFEDNLCRPAYAVNPTQSEFQEVKVKGKKGKKGKMQKVDSRILGFNTTSAPDRLNVGKRDYGDGTD